MITFNMRLAMASGCFALLLLATPTSARSFGTGAFPNAIVIDQQLKRGTATKDDVQRLLGVPNGTGGADMSASGLFGAPPMGAGAREIWYYEDIEATDVTSSNSTITMKLRQQILLIFFKGEVFDGYLWTTNAFTPTGAK